MSIDKRTVKAQAKADKAYRKANRPFYKKKRAWVLGGVGFLALVGVATGVNGGESDAVADTNADVSVSASSAPASGEAGESGGDLFPGQKDTDKVADMGASLDLESVVYTVDDLSLVTDALDDSYACASVSFVNESDETISQSGMFDFSLQTPAGEEVSIGIPALADYEPINVSKLAPGGNGSGDLCFKTKGESGDYILFKNPALFGDRGAWIASL